MSRESDLVYSTNPELNKKCSVCKKLISSCICKNEAERIDHTKILALLRIEKKHRGGKEVTIIERLPPSEKFLIELSRELKKKCGTGGTYKTIDNNGIVEIQGDKREPVRKELGKMGIRFKG